MYKLNLTNKQYSKIAEVEHKHKPILLNNNRVGFKTMDQYISYHNTLEGTGPKLGKLPILNLFIESTK